MSGNVDMWLIDWLSIRNITDLTYVSVSFRTLETSGPLPTLPAESFRTTSGNFDVRNDGKLLTHKVRSVICFQAYTHDVNHEKSLKNCAGFHSHGFFIPGLCTATQSIVAFDKPTHHSSRFSNVLWRGVKTAHEICRFLEISDTERHLKI